MDEVQPWINGRRATAVQPKCTSSTTREWSATKSRSCRRRAPAARTVACAVSTTTPFRRRTATTRPGLHPRRRPWPSLSLTVSSPCRRSSSSMSTHRRLQRRPRSHPPPLVRTCHRSKHLTWPSGPNSSSLLLRLRHVRTRRRWRLHRAGHLGQLLSSTTQASPHRLLDRIHPHQCRAPWCPHPPVNAHRRLPPSHLPRLGPFHRHLLRQLSAMILRLSLFPARPRATLTLRLTRPVRPCRPPLLCRVP